MSRSVMIVAGGTGGHVYPGLALADYLREHGVRLHWMGTVRGIEARLVPAHGLALSFIPVSGLRRSGILRWLTAPLTVCYAVICAVKAIVRVKPQVVIGMGGFVSGPGGIAAWLCRRPLVIHEQNAKPGLTNRVLALLASRVLEAFPGSFTPARAARVTGNPVRADIAAIAEPHIRLQGRVGCNVLIFGGSRGARALNEIVPQAIAACAMSGLTIRHQCGVDALEATRARYTTIGARASVTVDSYIDDMAAAYAWADLVIARAGALTIAEVAACGVAAILVPYPYAVDDHQTLNARYLADSGAAILLPESTLNPRSLAALLESLLGDRARLLDMAARARALARPQATRDVATQCLELIDA